MKKFISEIRWGSLDSLSLTLALVCASVVITMIIVSSGRSLSSLEEILFQVVILGTGISASWRIGRSSSISAAQETMRLHARPAFRTVLTLYESLSRLSLQIHVYNEELSDSRLETVESIVNEQIEIGRSALEDWRDIVPEDVEEIERRWIERRSS